MSSARPTLPDILRVSQEFATALDGREQAAFQQMSDAYVRIEQRLLSEADALLRDIMEKGYTASRAQQLERYKALLRQIKEQEQQYAFFTSQVIANEQQAAVTLALQEAETLAAMSLPGPMAGLMTNWNKLPVDAVQAFVGFAGDGSPLMPALQARFGEAVSGAVKEALLQGIALGWHPTKTVRKMGDALNGGLLNNALTWARTETVRASREASRRAYEANRNIVKGWIRKAALDGRTCAACIALDGTVYPATADGIPPMDDHPRGRCVAEGTLIHTARGWIPIEDVQAGDMALTHLFRERVVLATSRRDYAGPVVSIGCAPYLAMLTPEHPVLTNRGYVAAGQLTPEDDVALFPDARADTMLVQMLGYRGVVYDLQVAEDESYFAGGIVVHNCRMLPMTVGYAELLGIDLDEGPRVDWQTGPEWVKAMSPAEQRLWLDSHVGKGAGDAFAAGEFDLADIPKLNRSKAWGDSYTTKSLSELGIAKAGTGATVAPAVAKQARGMAHIEQSLKSIGDKYEESVGKLQGQYDGTIKQLTDVKAKIHSAYMNDAKNDVLDPLAKQANSLRDRSQIEQAALNKALSARRAEAIDVIALPVHNQIVFDATPAAKQIVAKSGPDIGRIVANKSLSKTPIRVVASGYGRASAGLEGEGIVHFTKGSGGKTLAHEVGHILETRDKNVLQKAIDFHAKRTVGQQEIALSKIDKGKNYKSSERAFPDKFPDPYCGKIYRKGMDVQATEIVSMGLEYMYSDPIKFLRDDPEYFGFIFDLLREP